MWNSCSIQFHILTSWTSYVPNKLITMHSYNWFCYRNMFISCIALWTSISQRFRGCFRYYCILTFSSLHAITLLSRLIYLRTCHIWRSTQRKFLWSCVSGQSFIHAENQLSLFVLSLCNFSRNTCSAELQT